MSDNNKCADCGHYWADHNTDDTCALCGCDWYRDAEVAKLARAVWFALRGEIEPIQRLGVTVKYPRWKRRLKRLIPGWRRRAQQRILEQIEAEE